MQTQNFSFFLNSKVSGPNSGRDLQSTAAFLRRTRLAFDEIRDTTTLVPSTSFPTAPFLLNAHDLLNVTAQA